MNKTVLALGLGIVLGAALPAAAVDVVNGCYLKSNGQFRVLLPGDLCLPSEVTVSLRSATDTSGLTPEVHDANGQFLGVGMIDELYIPSLRKWTLINLRDGTGEVWIGHLWYASEDCTGQAYAEYDNLHRVFRNRDKHYTVATEIVDPPLLVRSYNEGYSDSQCQVLDFALYPAAHARAVEVTLPFTTPIALPTRIVVPKTGLAGRLAR